MGREFFTMKPFVPNVKALARARARGLSPVLSAEDLEQESHMAALRGRRSITGPMSDLKDREFRISKRRPLSVRDERSHESAVIAKVDLDRLFATLTNLQKQAIVLHYLIGMTEGELANHLGVSVPVVRDRYKSGFRTLRKRVA